MKRKYLLLENYRAKSVIVSPTITNIDIYSLIRDDAAAYVNYMHVREGSVVQSMTLEYKFVDTDTGETDSELISTAIHEFRQRFADVNRTDRVREALVNVVPEFPPEGIEFVVPQRGDKRKLLAISLKNAEQYRTEKLKMMEKLNPDQRAMRTFICPNCPATSSVSTIPTSPVRIPWQRVWCFAMPNPQRKNTAISISKRWKAPTTMHRCAKYSPVAIRVCSAKAPTCRNWWCSMAARAN